MSLQKAVMALGYLFLVLIIVAVIGSGYLAVKGKALDRESKAFVDAAVPAIAAGWDPGELEKRASDEFKETEDRDELWQSFEDLRQLGSLRAYNGSSGEAVITFSLPAGCEVTADYDASVDFETGSVDLQITLIKHGKEWRILGFKAFPRFYAEDKDFI